MLYKKYVRHGPEYVFHKCFYVIQLLMYAQQQQYKNMYNINCSLVKKVM